MSFEGTVVNGVIVLDEPQTLDEGTRVEIIVRSKADRQSPKSEGPETAKDLLMQFAGCMTDLPSDLARNHDHYLHGTPKK
jgi:hypothetical protein